LSGRLLRARRPGVRAKKSRVVRGMEDGMKEESYFRNNLIVRLKDDDGALVGADLVDGKLDIVFVRIDGYAILPVEDYEALLSTKSLNTPPPEPSTKT